MRGEEKLIGRGILVKLVAAMIFLSIISAAIVLSVALNEQKQIMENNLIEENKRLAEVAARSIEAGYAIHAWPFRTLNQINASEDILFWWIVNSEGEIYLADNPEMYGKKIGSAYIEAGKNVVVDHVYDGEDIKFLIQPLNIGEPGKVEAFCIGISLKSVREATNKMIVASMGYFLIIVAFACVLSLFIARRFTRPITQLVEGTKAISRGEFDHQVATKTGDEIEGLADSFNTMAQRVKSAIEDEKAARREIENIMDTMINTLIVVGPDGRMVKANRAVFDLLGYSEVELIGMSFDEIIGPKNKEGGGGIELEKWLKEAAGSAVCSETTYRAKDGREIPVSFSSSVMTDEEGRLQGIVCDAEDITERKKSEEEIRKYMAELEQFNRLAVDRELKMIELKREINALLEQLGEEPRYKIAGEEDEKNYEL
jgi:PAS domain S-box-containing protein